MYVKWCNNKKEGIGTVGDGYLFATIIFVAISSLILSLLLLLK